MNWGQAIGAQLQGAPFPLYFMRMTITGVVNSGPWGGESRHFIISAKIRFLSWVVDRNVYPLVRKRELIK